VKQEQEGIIATPKKRPSPGDSMRRGTRKTITTTFTEIKYVIVARNSSSAELHENPVLTITITN